MIPRQMPSEMLYANGMEMIVTYAGRASYWLEKSILRIGSIM